MRYFSKLLLAFLAGALLLAGCKNTKSATTTSDFAYSPYVEAYTTGTISRHTPLYIVFAQDVPAEKLDTAALSKLVSITPKVEGRFMFQNNRNIVFLPKNGFERGQQYKVSLPINKCFDKADAKPFNFSFSTFPLELRASLESLNMNEDQENSYDVVCNITTPDSEELSFIQSLIVLSERADSSWSSNGRTHRLALNRIAAGKDGERDFSISVGNNKFGLSTDALLSFRIPDAKDFSVYDVSYHKDGDKYIEITFSAHLDPKQDLQGLAYIVDHKSQVRQVSNNKLRLYPDADATGEAIVYLNAAIRSKGGEKLGSDQRYPVDLTSERPSFRFVGKGVYVPSSNTLTIPFQAVYLRGIIVRVIKISERNIGQFLQNNTLGGEAGLIKVGQLVARKTIFLDDDPNRQLHKWDTYSLDLSKLIEPEPGAIYHVEMEYNRELSAYPCENSKEPRTKEAILADDEAEFRSERYHYDNAGAYYYSEDYDYGYYDYDTDYYKSDPCSNRYYNYYTKTGQNFVASNLGVIAKAGNDDKLLVLVHNITTAKPEPNVNVTVYGYQHQELGQGRSNDKGEVSISLPTGKPHYLIASLGKQRSYMKLHDGAALSLSTFDVSGATVHKGIKGFIYGERGIWRPGDTLHVAFMLATSLSNLPQEHPVTMELYSPSGQLYAKKTENQGSLGLYRFDFLTEPDAPTGAWRLTAHAGGASFGKALRIETIKPNRLKIVIDANNNQALLDKQTINIPMKVEWLHGAVARNLKYEVDLSFTPITTTFPGYQDFEFDSPVKSFSNDGAYQITGSTDEKGVDNLYKTFDLGTSAAGMLQANFFTRVYEDSGDFSIDGFAQRYSPYNFYVGIKPPKNQRTGYDQLDTGTDYQYEIATVDYEGKPAPRRDIQVKIFKVKWYWWWDSYRASLANYISESYYEPLKTLNLKTDNQGKVNLPLSFTNEEWGSYYINITDNQSKHSTGLTTYFDWPYYQGTRDMEGSDAASILSFKTDKTSYEVGEKIQVTLPSSPGSRAIVSIENGTKSLSVRGYDCVGTESVLTLDATAEMQPGAYIHITLLQPHANTENDKPIRLYGIVPVTVTTSQSHLYPQISMVDEIAPEDNYSVQISEKSGREMAYTLAIVDEGLLDLTRFQTPNPWISFNAREALGVRTWDLYNDVVGAYGGRIEQVFSIGGGDEAEAGSNVSANRFKPVVQYAGPFILKKGKTQTHNFVMPNYNGRVRVMVIAGDGKAYGHIDKSVKVRKPVMLLGTLPRVIGVGEEMEVPATVFATEDNVGNVKVSIRCSPNMEIVGESTQTLNFQQTEDKQVKFKIRVKGSPGWGKVSITADGKGKNSVYETDIEIRSVRRPVAKVVPVILEAGASWSEALTLPGANGTNNLTLEISSVPPLNLAKRLNDLLGYPHGCIEQITSKSFPQLYLKSIANLTQKQEILADNAIKETLRRYRSYQVSDGGVAYWPGGQSADGWGSIYAAHFMAEAEAKGYLVPDNVKRNLVQHLQQKAKAWRYGDNSYYYRSDEQIQAYRLYVLALHKSPELGAMNRLKELKLVSQTSKWMLAAAYALVGRKDVATSIIGTTQPASVAYDEYDLTYGSDLRDQAIKLQTLLLLDRGEEAALLCKDISAVLSSDNWLSTQTTAFALMSISCYIQKYPVGGEMQVSYNIAGKSDKLRSSKTILSTSIFEDGQAQADAKLTNNGQSTLFARIIMEGTPEQGEEAAYERGIKLYISYADMKGNDIDVSQLAQGSNFMATVTVTNPSAKGLRNLVLTEIFPSGWEIINTRFLEGGSEDRGAYVSYQDFRDDRVYSYIDYLPSGKRTTIKIPLTAVYKGSFYLPPVYCEAMYDNLIRANNQGQQVIVK